MATTSVGSQDGQLPPTRKRPAIHNTLNSLYRCDPAAPHYLPHSKERPHIVEEMQASTTNHDLQPQDCFPYATLPGHYLQDNETPEQALDRILVGVQELYVGGVWQKDRAQSSGSDEAKTAAFFNMIVASASGTPPSNKWRSHEAKMVERHRKPDVLLVSATDAGQPQNLFSSIISYCEIKKTNDSNNNRNTRKQLSRAEQQLMDMAGCVTSVQPGRRYFVGLALCNSILRVALFVRGCSVFTTSIDINAEPLAFLNIILTITDASPTWMGFDTRFDSEHHTVTLDNRVFDIVRTLFRSLGVGGRGTVVFLCKAKHPSANEEDRYFVLKESWVHAQWPNDAEIHSMMQKTVLKPLTTEEEETFGRTDKHEVFKYCVQVPPDTEWDYESKLPGIPIVEFAQIAHCDNPTHAEIQDGRYQERICEDTTANIMARINPDATVHYEPRVHESILYRSVGLPITMFSCRREFLNGMLGILCALYNGIRKGVMHCDLSQSNIMLRVAKLDMEDAIPDWPQPDQDSHPGRRGYTKRAGLLADWGLGLKYSTIESESDENRADGWVTGTFPFIATELLTEPGLEGSVAHRPHHDLESLFWVLWSISINYIGPYGKQRSWVARNGQVFTGSIFPRSSSLLSAIVFPPASGRRSARNPASAHDSARNSGSIATSASSARDSGHYCNNSGSGAASGTAITTPTTPSISLDVAACFNTTPITQPLPAPTKLTPTSRMRTEANLGFNRIAQDDKSAVVPVWATPEPHRCIFDDVLSWRMDRDGSTTHLTRPVTPYFKRGPGGGEFIRGIAELGKRFQWKFNSECERDLPPENPITHQEFFDILLKMRDAIDRSDEPSSEDIVRGRQSFERQIKIQETNYEQFLKTTALPDPCQEHQPSGRSGSKRRREEQGQGGRGDGQKRGRNPKHSEEE